MVLNNSRDNLVEMETSLDYYSTSIADRCPDARSAKGVRGGEQPTVARWIMVDSKR